MNPTLLKLLRWLLLFAVLLAIGYWVVDRYFPYLVTKFVGLLMAVFAVITGLFLRRKRS